MYRNKYIILIILLVLLTSGAVFGEEYSRPVVIASTVAGPLDAEDSALSGVIQEAVVLQLRLEDYEVRVVDFAEFPPAKNEQDYLLLSEYTITGNEIYIEIFCMETGMVKDEAIASGKWTGLLSLEMDRDIQKIIKRDVVPLLPESIAESRKETEKAAEAGEAWAIAALPLVAESGVEDELAEASASSRWRIGITGVIYLPLSETATFAETGYGGSLSAGYAFKVGPVSLGLGITGGVMYFSAAGASTADALLLPFGGEFRVGGVLPGAFQPWVRLAGGGAWFQITQSGSTSQSKIVPYAEAGLGTDIYFGRTVGLTVEVNFRVIFEGSVILYHVAPGLGAAFRF
jgi:hypothetical protein